MLLGYWRGYSYETDFKKETLNAPRGSRVFDLTEVLGEESASKGVGENYDLSFIRNNIIEGELPLWSNNESL